ncbi:MAG TPA: aminoglycoside phosphotransferase family protein [Nocardioidaceae bacterium]|nr:aminoglycoside phosphotransferase family protein [Nocardioidaceae bacterium]
MSGASPRAVGVRTPYTDIPDRVREWVDRTLGSPVVGIEEQVGGMSPGCATRLVTEDGTRAFVKAVGPELNPQTPDMFRNEAAVLTHLHEHALWARLLAVYDEPGDWVALLLEDVPGRHADTTSPQDVELLLEATGVLGDELAGLGTGLAITTCRESLERFGAAWDEIAGLPSDVLPGWLGDRAEVLRSSYAGLMEHAEGDHLVHGDLRNDNMIVRVGDPARPVVFVDWGMARTGPAWYDPLLLCLEWVEDPVFDELVTTFPSVRDLGEPNVTAFLATLGAWLGYRTTVAVDVGLPTLNDFRRRESARLLEGARRRLGVSLADRVLDLGRPRARW